MRDDLIKALPPFKSRFQNYKDYANRKMTEVLFTAGSRGSGSEDGVHVCDVAR